MKLVFVHWLKIIKITTGETIIDHQHEKRESRKIFDDEDGEYVEFEEA